MENSFKLIADSLNILQKEMPKIMAGVVKNAEKNMTPEQAILLKKRLEGIDTNTSINDLVNEIKILNNLKH